MIRLFILAFFLIYALPSFHFDCHHDHDKDGHDPTCLIHASAFPYKKIFHAVEPFARNAVLFGGAQFLGLEKITFTFNYSINIFDFSRSERVRAPPVSHQF